MTIYNFLYVLYNVILCWFLCGYICSFLLIQEERYNGNLLENKNNIKEEIVFLLFAIPFVWPYVLHTFINEYFYYFLVKERKFFWQKNSKKEELEEVYRRG